MKFGLLQQEIFGTSDGAYSSVTATEVGDSQITLTDYEAELAIRHFGKGKIHVGNNRSKNRVISQEFRLYPTGKQIKLGLRYPSKGRTRLRLCINKEFNPLAGDIWFLFRRDENLFLGSMSETSWRSLGQRDPWDESYVALANGETLGLENELAMITDKI